VAAPQAIAGRAGSQADREPAAGDGVVRRPPGRHEIARRAADPRDPLGETGGDGMERSGVVRTVAALEPEQETQMMHLEQIRERRRVRPGQQLLDVLEEPLAAQVAAEQLLLQRPPRPRRERRLARIER
jgi:hypothetical protein